MRRAISFLFFFSSIVASSAFALDEEDQICIHHIVDHFTHAWNQEEGKGSADYYAEDADFVNIFGMAFSGKQEIENRHVQIHKTFLKGTIFEVTHLKIREVKPDIAIVQVHWTVSGTETAEAMKGIFTHTLIKNQGRWEITSTQNTKISE